MRHKSLDSAYESAARIAILQSAMRIVLRSVLVIFSVEFGVMLALRAGGLPITPKTALIDSLVLSVLALPILYLVILRPVAGLAAEQAALAAESRLQTVGQAVPEGILIFGLDRRVRFANSAAEQMLRCSPSALRGMDISTLLPEQVVEQFQQAGLGSGGGAAAALGKGMVHTEGLRSNGERFPMELSASAIVSDGQVEFVVVTRDITDRKRAEATLREAEERYRGIFEDAVIGIFQTTPEGRYLSVNPAMASLYGFGSPGELMAARTDIARQAYADPARREQFKQAIAEHGVVRDFEYQVYRKDGSKCWFIENARVVRDDAGEISYYIGTVEDITERKRTRQELCEANERLTRTMKEMALRAREMALLGELGDSLQSCHTVDEASAFVSRTVKLLLPGYSGALFVFVPSRNLLEAVGVWGNTAPVNHVFAPDDCWALRAGRLHMVERPDPARHCPHLADLETGVDICVPMMAQGEALGLLHLRTQMSRAELRESGQESDEDKQRAVGTLARHTALALANLRLQETLRNQSIRDPLTGLFNRRYMEETMEREIRRAARNQKTLAVLMADLDHFKRYNDVHGHEAGDAVLRELGTFLLANTRGADVACRYGGEELTLILTEASLSAALARAQALLRGVRNLRVRHRGESLEMVSLSVGVAVYPEHGTTPEELLRAADRALYCAKAEGRNRVVCFEVDRVPKA